MDRNYRINSLDLDKVAIGILLPVFKTKTEFNQSYTTLDQAKSNLKNLVLTNKGERVMLPDFGCDIYLKLFEPSTDDLESDIKDTITEQINFWIPYIEIQNIVVDLSEDQNKVQIQILFNLKGNKFAKDRVLIEIQTQG